MAKIDLNVNASRLQYTSQFSGSGAAPAPVQTQQTATADSLARLGKDMFELGATLAGAPTAQPRHQGIMEGGCFPQPAPQPPVSQQQNLMMQVMQMVMSLLQTILGRLGLGGQQPGAPGTATPGAPTSPSAPGGAPAPAPLPAPAPARPEDQWSQGKHGIKGKAYPDETGKINIPGYGEVQAPPPGKKEKIKIDKKKYIEVKTNKDGSVSVETKKKGGFFSKIGGAFKKIGGFVKKALPIITTVASFIPGVNAIAIPLKIATSAMGAIDAIKNKNWLGAIGSVAGGVAGAAGAFGAKGLANVAGMVAQGADKTQAFLGAVKAKSPSGILGAAAGMLQFGSQAVANKSAEWSTRLNNWAETAQKWGQYAGYVENPQAAIEQLIRSQVGR